MSNTKAFNAESTESNQNKSGLILVATGVALGLGAVAWLMKRKHKAKIAWDPEKILEACDAAAAKLDDILFTEARHAG